MDKPIPEAVELLRAFQSQFGARRPDEDEDDAETWDRIDAVCKAITAAQQQGQVAPPSAPVGVEGLLADLETIWHSVSDDKETNAAYQRLKSALTQQTAAAHEPCAAVAAIQFALNDPEGMTFLRLWNEGEFDALRREWPDAPSEVYIGADPLATQHQEPPHDHRG